MRERSGMTETNAILLDFDGPVCSVFSGYPAPHVADELRAGLRRLGIAATEDVREMLDPLAVLRWTWTEHPEATEEIETILVAAERKAIQSAQPTPYAHHAIASARHIGHLIAIVSNNSTPAIIDYLEEHDLSDNVVVVAARPFGKPGLMKPNPALVIQAVQTLDVSPEQCVFIGDAVTDIEAGRAAGVRVIGYVKTPKHGAALASARPDYLIDSMSELPDALDKL